MIRALLERLLPGRVEGVNLYRQLAAHEVEQCLGDPHPVAGRGQCERRVRVPAALDLDPIGQLARPYLLVGATLAEAVVVDPQQPSLFEVRGRQPPATLLVAVDPVGKHLPQHLVGFAASRPAQLRISRIQLGRQPQLIEDRLRDAVMRKPLRAYGRRSAVKARAQEADLDEVIEVPGLERRVLPIVREAEQLARLGIELAVLPQLPHCGEPKHGRRSAAPPGAQRAQLAEVGALRRPVGHTAT